MDALRVIALAGLLSAAAVACADEDAASTPVSSGAGAGAGAGTVPVTGPDVAGAVGFELAGMLFAGTDSTDPDSNVRGGFSVAVDADPFTTTEVVRVPQAEAAGELTGPFPWVTEEVLVAEPGHYVLTLWIAPAPMAPYSRWVPAEQTDLGGCSTPIIVPVDGAASVTVLGVPPWTGGQERACVVE